MSIRIRTIKMPADGPFKSSTDYSVSKVNLFYGKNESGKSYLTRSILSSIFKTTKDDSPIKNNTTVIVDGLSDEGTKFTARSKDNIEGYVLPESDPLISDLSRLCVVSEGNLTLDPEGRNNIKVDTLRGYFSDQALRDRILKNISATVRSAELTIAGPTGSKTGEFREINNWNQDVNDIDDYFRLVNENYADSELEELERAIKANELRSKEIQDAKKNKAFGLNQRLIAQQRKNLKYSNDTINRAWNTCQNLRGDLSSLKEINKAIGEVVDHQTQIDWCKNAQSEIEKNRIPEQAVKSTPSVALIVIAAILFIVLVAFVFLGQQILAAITGAVIFAVLIYSLLSRPDTESVKVINPNEAILAEFSALTGKLNPTVVDIQTEEERLVKAQAKQEFNQSRQKELENGSREKIGSLKLDLAELKIEYSEDIQQIEIVLKQLKTEMKDAELAERTINGELRALGVPEDEIYEVAGAGEYNKADEANVSTALEKLKLRHGTVSESLKGIAEKGRILVGNTASGYDMNEILNTLRGKREELLADIRQKKAEVIAGKLVSTYFDDQTKREDIDIKQSLSRSQIQDFVTMFTERYSGLTFESNEIQVLPDEFPLSELSTGTQEQVLLAIRFGILQHHLNDKQMFIILDDAFQHSDWARREHLVDSLGQLVEKGWQILYFTMDDHIRDLFETRLKPKFGAEYKLFNLSN